MHTQTLTCTYTCTLVCTWHVCTHMHACVATQPRTHACTRTPHTRTPMQPHKHSRTQALARARSHIHTHTRTHASAHARTQADQTGTQFWMDKHAVIELKLMSEREEKQALAAELEALIDQHAKVAHINHLHMPKHTQNSTAKRCACAHAHICVYTEQHAHAPACSSMHMRLCTHKQR